MIDDTRGNKGNRLIDLEKMNLIRKTPISRCKNCRNCRNKDIDEAIKLANLIETKISHELNLINHRMSWLTISQSFLFTAFASLAVSSPKERTEFYVISVALLKLLIPLIGLCISLFVYIALISALNVLDKLLIVREQVVEYLNGNNSLSIKVPILGKQRWTHKVGQLPPSCIPLVLILGWSILLVSVLFRLRGMLTIDKNLFDILTKIT